jgi:hypothetical protein
MNTVTFVHRLCRWGGCRSVVSEARRKGSGLCRRHAQIAMNEARRIRELAPAPKIRPETTIRDENGREVDPKELVMKWMSRSPWR